MHDAYIDGLSENNIKCVLHSGEKTEQLYIFCYVTDFMSDFLSFMVLEHIQFFHRALQLFALSALTGQRRHLACKKSCT